MAKAAKPEAGRATVRPKSMPEKGSIAPATTAQAAHSATRPASTPQPRVAIMIGNGARYASANARAVPWTVTTKRSAEARAQRRACSECGRSFNATSVSGLTCSRHCRRERQRGLLACDRERFI